MKLSNILNTEECTTHKVTLEVKGGSIVLDVTEKYTSAWNQALMQFERDKSQVFLSIPSDKKAREKYFADERITEDLQPAERKLYASLVTGWSLEDDFSKDGVIALFTAYPIVAPSISSFLAQCEAKLEAEKKSSLNTSEKDSKTKARKKVSK